ncbi:MAG: hypothetical protein DRI73_10585, partial [Bacteroidetes bacterium]
MKNGFKIFTFLIIFFISFSVCNAQENDSGCKRTAFMGKCENLALPDDWEERSRDYYDCRGEHGSFNFEKCKHLLPDYGRKFSNYSEEAMFSNLRTWIPAVLHHNRFSMVNAAFINAYRENAAQSGIPVKEDMSTIPEYFFEGTYDCARNPTIREPEDQFENPIDNELYPSSLNIRMYFDGEEKELVKEWTVNSPLHVWLSLTNRMFKYSHSLMRQDVPITNLLDAFEKKPIQCQIKPEKDELGEGQEIDIVLSEFRDALQQPSREFNRIIVHAQEGRILNGSRCEAGSDYRVFSLDEQPITVHYRAPKSGNTSSDKISIYNSCEILSLEKQPLRVTKPHEEIATCDLRIKHYAWNGSFNIDVTKRFQCNVQEKASEIRHEEIRANDEHTQRANVTIGMDDFDLAVNPSIPGTRLIREASGEMQCMMNEDHFTATRLEKTECYNESAGEGEFSHIWVSPGNWSTKHETLSGQASRTIKKGNINLLIVKDIELDKDAMKSLQKQMQEAAKNKDYAAIQNLSGQMTGMVQGDQNSNIIPIRIRIEIGFDITKKDLITKTFNYKSYNVCLKENEDDNGSNNIELPIAIPMVVEMKGTYTRGEDGSDIINASV